MKSQNALKALLPGKGRVVSELNSGAAIVAIGEGSLVFVPARLVDARFAWRAEVVLKYTSRETKRDDDAPFVAVEIQAVYKPSVLPKSAEVLCYVVGYDYKKGGGKLRFVGDHPLEELKSARFKNDVIKGYTTENGAAFKAKIKVTKTGLIVESMVHDSRIQKTVDLHRRQAKQATIGAEPLIVTEQGQTVVLGAIPSAHSGVIPVFNERLD